MAQSFTYKISCKVATKTAVKPKQQIPVPSQKPSNPPKLDKSPTPIGDRVTAQVQIELNRLGYKAGIADGLLGPKTRDAILRAQRVHGLTQTGLPSTLLLERLRAVR
jgi:peptidoglycan hydrolase-like protein with peptidoglycan-binding domain